jgi:hypothetical protein
MSDRCSPNPASTVYAHKKFDHFGEFVINVKLPLIIKI